MRTNDPRVTTSIRLLGYLSAAGAIGVALAACSSALHLDPPGSGGTGTGSGGEAASTTTTGTGGSGPVKLCNSNPDCTAPDKSICDTVTNKCVQCLVNSDCSQSVGLTCFGGTCGCPSKGAALCPAPKELQCVDTLKSSLDCGSCGHACFGACEASKCVGPWERTSIIDAPEARTQHVAVWADSKMIVWGGRTASGATATGGVYDPASNTWTATSMTDAPSARFDAGAVWDDTGKRMIVWGGRPAVAGPALNTGAVYDPAKNVWETIALKADTPTARWGHTALWTGTKMLVWGGTDGTTVAANGGLLTSVTPATPTWDYIPPLLGHRSGYAAAWTGTNFFVWGGLGNDDGVTVTDAPLGSGASYEPGLMAWTPLSLSPLVGRSQASAVWTGSATVVWGGYDGAMYLDTGAKYSGGGGWLSANNPAPTGRVGHSAALIKTPTGNMTIIWGGLNATGFLDSGYTFNESSLDWSKALSTGPIARAHHSTVVNGTAGMTGSKMIIWGGVITGGLTNTGAIFDASTM